MLALAAAALACPFTSPCVIVDREPRLGEPPPGTVQTFRGRGWAPGSTVSADFGSYCPPRAACAGTGLGVRFRADRRGSFTFRLRAGRTPPPGPGPKAGGGEEVRFGGTTPRGTSVGRFAVPLPPPSTPAERRQARDVGAAALRLARTVDRRRPVTNRAVDAQQAELGRCRDLLDAAGEAGERQGEVVSTLTGSTLDLATYGVDAAAFAAFAARLEGVRATGRLGAATAAWVAAIRTPLPRPEPDLCTVLERWEATGYSRSTEPVAPGPSTFDRLRQDPRVALGAAALRDLGVGRAEQELFAGDVLGLERYIEF